MFAFIAAYWYLWLILAICGFGLMLSSLNAGSVISEVSKEVSKNPLAHDRARMRETADKLADKLLIENEAKIPPVIHNIAPIALMLGIVFLIFSGVLKLFGY